MSDLENMLNVENENGQPNDAVAADLEATSTTPQGEATDQVQFFIEDEGSQEHKPNNFDDTEKRRAAFAKAKRKEREAQQNAKKLEQKLEEERKERERLAAQVAALSAGPKPTIESCDYDEDEYHKKHAEWVAKQPKQIEEPVQNEKVNEYEPDYDAQFTLSEGDNLLQSGGIADVKEKVSSLSEILQSKFGANPDAVFDNWAVIAEESGEDYNVSSARYMIARNPAVLDEIARCRTPLGINRILKREASKLKTRAQQKLETQPEPSINSSGPIDNATKAAQKAKEQWMKSGSAADYQSYQAAKKLTK